MTPKQKSRAKIKQNIYEKLEQYFMDHPCVDCGEINPLVLQFDHVRGVKSKDINKLIKSGYGWASVSTEITKCDVRCSNCHAIVTSKRGNFTRWKVWSDSYAAMQSMEKLQGRKTAKVRRRKRM